MTKEIICADCGNKFYFSDRDQEFYKRGGAKDGRPANEAWPEPKRCKVCRLAKKEGRVNDGGRFNDPTRKEDD